MTITLVNKPGTDPETGPYNLEAKVADLSAEACPVLRIPVHGKTGDPSPFNVEICGFRIEADRPEELAWPVDRLLRGLVNVARFPTYVFVARRSRQIYPVYTLGDEVLATTPGGPVFRHIELAKVRDFLSDYLHAVGELGVPGKSEALHVRGVDSRNLSLIRPDFYLKKRSGGKEEWEFWAPVFRSEDNYSIYTHAASGKREVDLAGGHEILLLRGQVAQALQAVNRLHDPWSLRVDRLQPEAWRQVQSTLEEVPAALVSNNMKLELYSGGRGLIAREYRQEENRYSLYFGTEVEDLIRRTAADLIRRNILDRPQELTLQWD